MKEKQEYVVLWETKRKGKKVIELYNWNLICEIKLMNMQGSEDESLVLNKKN